MKFVKTFHSSVFNEEPNKDI